MNLPFRVNVFSALVIVLYAGLVAGATRPQQKLVQYSIPEHRPLKKALGYYQDAYSNFTELVAKYGYSSEQHTVTTEDGYILTVFRILPQCSEVQVTRLHPVLLAHGLMDSSDVWIVAGKETGLAYALSNNCYDVWAINHRGNRYSRKHVRLNPDTDTEYWNYSFDELGNFDLAAVIDYILLVNKRPRLFFVGHSQGTTSFFVLNSLRPEYNDKLRLSIQLAPVAWLKNIKSPLPLIAAQGTEPLKNLVESLGYYEIFARDQIIHTVMEFLCQIFPDQICGETLSLMTSYKAGTISSKTLAVAFGHLIVGVSSKSLAHFGQLITSKRFRRFDEGKNGNIKRYGSPKPPKYNVSRVTSPVVLINAKNDLISTLEDASILRSRLPNLVEDYIVPEQYWSHPNHVFGINAPTAVYSKILDYFSKFDAYYG